MRLPSGNYPRIQGERASPHRIHPHPILPSGYGDWLKSLKSRVASASQPTALAINQELVTLYHSTGKSILPPLALRSTAPVIQIKEKIGEDSPLSRVVLECGHPLVYQDANEFMATPDTSAASAPWDTKRGPNGQHLIRRSLPWLGGIFLLSLIAWGLWPKPVIIETGAVVRGPLTVRVSEEGKTRVRNRYIVAAPVAGKMRRVPLKPGDKVQAGETLLTAIEPVASPLLDPRARAQAEALVSMHEASRKQAVASLEAKQSASQIAAADRDRIRAVTRVGTVSDTDRDRAEGDAAMRAAEVRAAEFSLQVIDYELAQARAALERPDLITAGNLVEVNSPVSGHVLKVMQESEMVVTPGTQILEIGDPTDIEIEAEILSRDAVTIRPGDAVEVEQWGGENPLKGRVRRVEPAAFTKISALGVEEQRVIVLSDLLDIPEAAKALGDRFRVEVRVAVWHADDVLIVPAGALFREGNAWKTYVFRDGEARLTLVDAGHTDGRLTEVISGLQVGDEVLLHPPDTVTDGTSVKKR